MEKQTEPEKEILQNIGKRKITFMFIFILIIFSGFLLFNQLTNFTNFFKNEMKKAILEKVI